MEQSGGKKDVSTFTYMFEYFGCFDDFLKILILILFELLKITLQAHTPPIDKPLMGEKKYSGKKNKYTKKEAEQTFFFMKTPFLLRLSNEEKDQK